MTRHPSRPTSRGVGRQLSAWLMALLLTLVVAEPFRAHACPVHALAASRLAEHGATAAGDTAAAAAGHDAHAAMGAAGAHATDGAGAADPAHPGGHGPDGAPHLCDCLGTCGIAALLGLPTPATARIAATVAVARPAPLPAAPVAARAGEHVLPFANGPPAVA